MHDSNSPRDSNSVFHTSFSPLPDPRRTTKGHFKYPLDEILFLTISAVLCGADGWVAVHTFGKSKQAWLRQYFPYENGIPSHDVLGKLFAERGIKVGDDLIRWLVVRIERSLVAAQAVVATLDAAALARRRAITIPLAREVVDGQGEFGF